METCQCHHSGSFSKALGWRSGVKQQHHVTSLTLTATCSTITTTPIWSTGGMVMWGMVKTESLGVGDGICACVQMFSWPPLPSWCMTQAGWMCSHRCWEMRPVPGRQGESWLVMVDWTEGDEAVRCHSHGDICPGGKIKYRPHMPHHNCSDKSIILTSVSLSVCVWER